MSFDSQALYMDPYKPGEMSLVYFLEIKFKEYKKIITFSSLSLKILKKFILNEKFWKIKNILFDLLL